MDIKQWLSENANRRITDQDIALMLGVTRKTANKRINEGLSSDDLIKLCNELGINQTLALVELGRLPHKDVLQFLDSEGQLVETAEDADLVIELARRIVPIRRTDEVAEIVKLRKKPDKAEAKPEDITEEVDHEAIIRQINEGKLQVAAQEATEPLEEHFT